MKDLVKGAYDLKNNWWFETEIKSFSGGVVCNFFGCYSDQIKIIEIERKEIQ